MINRRLPLAAVRRAMLDCCAPVIEEIRALDAAAGCVLARAERSAQALPPVSIALAAGWAVAAAETFAASPYAPVAVDETHPLDIGEGVPGGCDAIVPRISVVMESGHPMLQTPLTAGENLRHAGEDISSGAMLLAAGRRLTPLGVALAGFAGVDFVAVRVPRVLVVHADAAAAAAAARLVVTAARRCGAACRMATIGSPDDRSAAFPPHLTIAIGDVTIGLHDPAFAWAAARNGWRGIGCPAMRPGDTVICGVADGSPVMVIPSRLDAVLSAVLLIARPLIGALAGATESPWRERRALTRKIASAVGLSELVLLADAEDGRAWTPVGVGDFGWIDAAAACAYAEVPPESEGAGERETFEATMLAGPGSSGLWSEM